MRFFAKKIGKNFNIPETNLILYQIYHKIFGVNNRSKNKTMKIIGIKY